MLDSNQQPHQMGRQTMGNPSNMGLQDGRMRRVAVIFAAAGLVFAACSSDSDSDSTDTVAAEDSVAEVDEPETVVVTLAEEVAADEPEDDVDVVQTEGGRTTTVTPTETAPTVPVCTLAGGAQCDGQPSDTAVEDPPAVEEASEEAGEGFEMLPLPEGATVKFSQPVLFDPQDGQCKAWLPEARPLSPGVEYPEGTVGTTTTSVDGKTTTTVFRCEDGEWVQVGEP